MSVNKTPGVYVQEIAKLPPSIAEVETAIPAFIGYTEKAIGQAGQSLTNVPVRVVSLLEYEKFFGGANPEKFTIKVNEVLKFVADGADPGTDPDVKEIISREVEVVQPAYSKFRLYYHLQMYFANGGGPCYIVSTGSYAATPSKTDFDNALAAIEKVDEPTLLVLSEATALDKTDYYSLAKSALSQCNKLMDRFAVLDVVGNTGTEVSDFRTGVGTNFLKYGAAYYPNLSTGLNYAYDLDKIEVSLHTRKLVAPNGDYMEGPVEQATISPINAAAFLPAESLKTKKLQDIGDQNLKDLAAASLNKFYINNLPPSSAVAGVYAQVDNDRGVWKAPANVSLNLVNGLSNASGAPITIDDQVQDGLNVDPVAGKSINAIRAFLGRGIIIWGARTLAGNDNEWRYVPVRRLFNYVEESCKKSTSWAVFEPNDANTWLRIKSQIENFLNNLWRDGALAGAKPEQAYYVSVGLGSTMTAQDILEGRMIVEIGMAAVRPAEFIVLKFSHLLQQS